MSCQTRTQWLNAGSTTRIILKFIISDFHLSYVIGIIYLFIIFWIWIGIQFIYFFQIWIHFRLSIVETWEFYGTWSFIPWYYSIKRLQVVFLQSDYYRIKIPLWKMYLSTWRWFQATLRWWILVFRLLEVMKPRLSCISDHLLHQLAHNVKVCPTQS